MAHLLKHGRLIAVILLFSAAMALIGGGVLCWRTAKFKKTAIKVQGTILALEKKDSSDTGNPVYHPVYTFTDKKNVEHKKTSELGSYPPAYQVGDSVTILYPPENPQNATIDDFWELWLLPMVLSGIALVEFFFGSLILFLMSKTGNGPPVTVHKASMTQ